MGKATKILVVVSVILCLTIAGVFLYRACNVTVVHEEGDPVVIKRENTSVLKTRPVIKFPETNVDVKNETIQVEQIPVEQPENLVEEEPFTTKPEHHPVVENKDVTSVFISPTKSLFNQKELSVANLPRGKVYYSGANGRLESSVIMNENNQLIERLFSFNTRGDQIDQLDIGLIDENAEKKVYASLSQNTVSVYERIWSNKKEEDVTHYSITPNLRFVKGKTYKKII